MATFHPNLYFQKKKKNKWGKKQNLQEHENKKPCLFKAHSKYGRYKIR